MMNQKGFGFNKSGTPSKQLEELSKLEFNQLRRLAKSIYGIGKYGDLKKNKTD